MKMGNRTYDILKFILLIMPSFCTFVASTITAIMTGDWRAIIVSVASALSTFAGSVVEVSSKIYWDEQNKMVGTATVSPDEGEEND